MHESVRQNVKPASETYAEWHQAGFDFKRQGFLSIGWWPRDLPEQVTYFIGDSLASANSGEILAASQPSSASLDQSISRDLQDIAPSRELNYFHYHAALLVPIGTQAQTQYFHQAGSGCILSGDREDAKGSLRKSLLEATALNGVVLKAILENPQGVAAFSNRLDFRGIAPDQIRLWDGVKGFLEQHQNRFDDLNFRSLYLRVQHEILHLRAPFER